MHIRLDQPLPSAQGSIKNRSLYLLGFVLLLAISACSFPTSATKSPSPSPTQEIVIEATATYPAEPTPTPQSLPPNLVESDPFPNSEVGLDDSLTFFFNQPMDRDSVEASFSGLSGRFKWIDDATLIFSPDTTLPPATQINLQIDTQARATNGLSLVEPISLMFQSVGYLRLAQNIPEDGSTAVDPSSAVVATFNRPVVPIGAEQGTLPAAFSLEPEADGRGEWLNTSTYVFYPEPSLVGGAEYTVRIKGDLEGLDGSPLQTLQSWSFTTNFPRMISSEPVDGTRNISLDEHILLTFNQPMDPDSVADNFTMMESDANRIRGEFSWNEDATEFTFTPNNLLKRGLEYSFAVSEETLSGGGTSLGSEQKSAFQTFPELAVVRSDPVENGSKEVYSGIAIDFNAPIKSKDVLQFITLRPSVANLEPYVDEEEGTLWLNGFFEPDNAYTLIISPNLPDKWSGRLGKEYTLNFRTLSLDPSLLVSIGSDVVFLTPDQSSIDVQITNLSNLPYSLGPVPLEEFKELIAPGGYEARQTYRPQQELTFAHSVDIPANQSTTVNIPLSVDGGPLAPGIYALRFNLNVEYIFPGPYFLVVSDINTTLKLGATDALVWAVSLQDGSAAEDIPVAIYSERGEVLAQGRTDSQGVLHTEIPVREMEDIYGISYAILGEPGEETFSAALSSWGQGLDGSSFGYQVDYTPPHLEAYLYTDRPIYRPGQTVNFRAILRQVYNGRYSLPDRSNLILNLTNDFGEQIDSLDLPLSDFGTAHGIYTLPEDTEPGVYRLISEQAHFSSVAFQVAEYRKPEIDLNVSFPSEQALAGETINGTVRARFFFDAPAGNVPITWTLFRTPEIFNLPGYQVGKSDTRWLSGLPGVFSPISLEQVSQGQGETDPSGIFDIELVIPPADQRYRYSLEVTATDESELPVSARSDVLVNPAEYYIGIRPDVWSGRAGSEIGFDVQVVDWDQEPAGQQTLSAEFQKVVWERVEAQPGVFRGFPTYEPKYTTVSSTDFSTAEDGKARLAFTPTEPGTYQLQVTGSGLGGETALSQALLWVGGPGQAVWPNLPNQRLRLTADRSLYQQGDTAQVFVPNPFGAGALALVTIERGVLFEHQIIALQESGAAIPVLLGDEQAPNVYISVTLLKPDGEGEPDFRQGYLILPVEPIEQTLNISLTSDPVRAEPGGEVTFDLLVTDAHGKPVEGEFSLSVVDLAVLALSDPNSKNIVSAFYGDQPLGVSTSLSLAASTKLRSVEALGIGGGGGGELVSPQLVREEFLDTAYWNAAIVTDADGHAQVKMTLPDNLTTWQLDTRGVTQDTLVGQDEGLVVSTKDLIVRPVTPRFLVFGDHALLAAVVQNNTADILDVDVSLQSNGFNLDDPSTALQEVPILPGGRKRLEWWGTTQDVESVDLVFAAEAGILQDASRPAWGALPVLRYTAPQTFGTSGTMDEGGERLEVVSLPRSFDSQNGEFSLEMAPTLAASMMSALDVLELYPYNSTEQVVSRYLPNMETYRVVQDFGLEDPDLEGRLERTLEDSLAQLVARQNVDGGWGWWKDDQSDPYITAYALFGLVRAEEAGVDIGSGVIDSAVEYLTATLTTPDMLSETWQLDRLAFIHYVLSQSGAGDLVGAAGLYEERLNLNPWAHALLAMTLESLSPNDERIQTIYSDLEASAIRSATGAHWENQEHSWQNMSTTIQSTAVVLYALTRHDPASPLVADALRYLMAHRQASGAWSSTYETSWILMALSEVMRGTGELSGEFDFSADLNNTPLAAGQASGISQLNPVEATVPISSLYPHDPNSLTLMRGDGSGRLYYNAHLNVHRPVEEVAPLEKGLTISRAYFPSEVECIEGDCPAIQNAHVGELVTVRLTLTIPETTYYLLVEDYIPAGTEILDTSLKTSQHSDAQQYNPRQPFDQGWGWWYFSGPQIHDDHISWAVDVLPAGTYELTYELVTLQPGEFRVLPARARQLYFPEVQGNSAGEIFEIK
ncbi:MAG: Ig-like domain-containing protein [Anaerolineales bacterium]